MNEIIVGRSIEGISLNPLEFLVDESGELIKFKTKEHAIRFLKENGADEEDIYYMQFIYTNESGECKCHICEKRGDCYMQDKLQRLPRELTNGMGLGLCPKLNEEKVIICTK